MAIETQNFRDAIELRSASQPLIDADAEVHLGGNEYDIPEPLFEIVTRIVTTALVEDDEYFSDEDWPVFVVEEPSLEHEERDIQITVHHVGTRIPRSYTRHIGDRCHLTDAYSGADPLATDHQDPVKTLVEGRETTLPEGYMKYSLGFYEQMNEEELSEYYNENLVEFEFGLDSH